MANIIRIKTPLNRHRIQQFTVYFSVGLPL
jgi:hypothetical protein